MRTDSGFRGGFEYRIFKFINGYLYYLNGGYLSLGLWFAQLREVRCTEWIPSSWQQPARCRASNDNPRLAATPTVFSSHQDTLVQNGCLPVLLLNPCRRTRFAQHRRAPGRLRGFAYPRSMARLAISLYHN